MKIYEKKQKLYGLFLLSVMFVALIIVSQIFSHKGNAMIQIGPGRLPLTSLNGVLTALMATLTTLMVCIYHRKGYTVAMALMGVYMFTMLQAVFFAKQLAPLPGIANTLIVTATQMIIYKQLARREWESMTDFLTGLYNRRGLMRVIERKTKEKNAFYLFYIDLDDFKFINDNFGHESGDRVLKIIAERITQVGGREVIVSRMGGDEFVMIIPAKQEVQGLADKLLELLAKRIEIQAGERRFDCYVTASAGVVRYPEDTTEAGMLMKYADIAMYQAKKEGKNKYYLFDKKIEQEVIRQSELEGLIKEGLDKQYFYTLYQPQFDINSRKLRGFEALLRLKTANGSFVSPAEFIPAAERTDLILRVDEYVLNYALRQFCEKYQNKERELFLSINISAKNICRYGFAGTVKKILLDTGFPPECLELEITEYCLANALDTAIDNIQKLKRIGVHIALDDFGTGYASLSNLSKLSIDLLKIDKSFIDEIGIDKKSADFIKAVISIGHLHDCMVVSEGVENQEQLAVLQRLGCDYLQGYLWGRPEAYEQAVERMKKE